MIEIRLQRGMWMYDPAATLGKPGGFGAVFLGSGSKHKKVAVKRLHINASQAAHRELHIADVLANRDLEYVMPVYDAGQDAESNNYYIVMPCAEMSLRDAIRKRGVFNEIETVNILKQIALGLLEVSDLVHRDLKPENVLYHEHRWKIADFGYHDL